MTVLDCFRFRQKQTETGFRLDSKFITQAPKHLSECAIQLKFLHNFSKQVEPNYTSHDVVDKIIIPKTLSRRCRFVDVVDQELVGTATHYVSHCWDAHFLDLLECLIERFGTVDENSDEGVTFPDDVYVWLDIFAINQHLGGGNIKEEIPHLPEVISNCQSTLLCLDRKCTAFSRLWIIYEIWMTTDAASQAAKANEGLNGPKLEVCVYHKHACIMQEVTDGQCL